MVNKDLVVDGPAVDKSVCGVEFDELGTGGLEVVERVGAKRDMCFFSDLGLLVSDSLVRFSESAVALTTRTSVVNHTSHAPMRDIGVQGLSSTWWCF